MVYYEDNLERYVRVSSSSSFVVLLDSFRYLHPATDECLDNCEGLLEDPKYKLYDTLPPLL